MHHTRPASRAVLALCGVHVRLHAGVPGCAADVRALAGIDLTVGAGEVVAVAGAPSSGKTVLLLTAAGLLAPARGRLVRAGAARVLGHGVGAAAHLHGACVPRGVRLVLHDDVRDASVLLALEALVARRRRLGVLAAVAHGARAVHAAASRAPRVRVVWLHAGRLVAPRDAGAAQPCWPASGAAAPRGGRGRVASVAEGS
jgi:energy-coupling factor transporter ATP-binding protein EcfA2